MLIQDYLQVGTLNLAVVDHTCREYPTNERIPRDSVIGLARGKAFQLLFLPQANAYDR